jgi:hypothetical protein
MVTSRERAFLLVGAAVALATITAWVLGWTQSGCGFSGCVPGGPTNAVQYNVGGSFGGVGPGTATTVLHGNASNPPAYSAIDLTSDVTNVLPMAAGGTGAASAAANQVLVSNGTSWVSTTIPDCATTSGSHLNYTQSTGVFACSGVLSGTTSSIGGGLLTVGSCTSGTVAVTGATTGAAVLVTPVTYPGDGATWYGYVSSSGTVTVKVCVLVALAPTSTAYNVRVIP